VLGVIIAATQLIESYVDGRVETSAAVPLQGSVRTSINSGGGSTGPTRARRLTERRVRQLQNAPSACRERRRRSLLFEQEPAEGRQDSLAGFALADRDEQPSRRSSPISATTGN
jgi:hypothetical protein